jgi:hypothetical protein
LERPAGGALLDEPRNLVSAQRVKGRENLGKRKSLDGKEICEGVFEPRVQPSRPWQPRNLLIHPARKEVVVRGVVRETR